MKSMRKYLLFILLALSCLTVHLQADEAREQAAIRDFCAELISRYPAATLQDIYKTCYQDFFGAEHLMQDTAAARQYIQYELSQCAGQDLSAMPAQEPTGFRHRFVRLNLSEVTSGRMTADELQRLFIDAAGTDNAYSEDWYGEWQRIEAIALEVNPAWQGSELQTALREAAQRKAPVRHSEQFRNTYNPHYRIIRNKSFEQK